MKRIVHAHYRSTFGPRDSCSPSVQRNHEPDAVRYGVRGVGTRFMTLTETGVVGGWEKGRYPESFSHLILQPHRAGRTGRIRCWKVLFPDGGGGLSRCGKSQPQTPDIANKSDNTRVQRMYIARVRLRMGVDKTNLLEREHSTQTFHPGEQEILTPSAARILWTRIFTGKSCVNPEVRIFRLYAMSEI